MQELRFRFIGEIGASRAEGAEKLLDNLSVAREMENIPLKRYFDKFAEAKKAIAELNKKKDFDTDKRSEHTQALKRCIMF